MPLLALVLASLAHAGERSDAERADAARSDAERSDAARSDAERAERHASASSHRDRSTAERAHDDEGRNGAHVRAYGSPRRGGARYHRPAYRAVYRVERPPPARVVVHSDARAPRARPWPGTEHEVALTLNLVDVPAPLVSATAEFALTRSVSLAGSAALGLNPGGALYDLGGQARGYFLGDFDAGVYAAAGVGVTNFSAFAANDTAGTLGGALGAKVSFPVGLTLDGSVGVEAAAHADIAGIYPTAKIGIGWAF